MLNNEVSNEQKLCLLNKAIKHHTKYKLDAMSGRGCDRVLFGMIVAAKIKGLPTPEIFQLTVSIIIKNKH